jgi:hypothetical protein
MQQLTERNVAPCRSVLVRNCLLWLQSAREGGLVPVLQVFKLSLSRLARLSPDLTVSLTAGMALAAPNAAAHGALSERKLCLWQAGL